jgi:hypothetical protein
MLRVDGYNLGPCLGRYSRHECTRHHERFLVGEGNALACPQCRQRRVETRRPNDRVQYDCRVRQTRGFDQRVGPARP